MIFFISEVLMPFRFISRVKFREHTVCRVLTSTISTSKLSHVKCCVRLELKRQAKLIFLSVHLLISLNLKRQTRELRKRAVLNLQLHLLYYLVLLRLLLQPNHSFQPHHSRKQQRFLQMQLLRVRLTRFLV